MTLTIIVFVVILGVLVFVHEFGHFITAKRAGLTVEEFGFGFPPRIASIKRGGTRYSINWIPFGGFVKILGESGEDEKNPKSFASRTAGVRALILLAGVAMNFLLAFVLLIIVNIGGAATSISEAAQLPGSAKISDPVITITSVSEKSPAQEAGVRAGDQINLIAGQQVESEEQVVALINEHRDKATTFNLTRGKQKFDLQVTPRSKPPDGQGPLGISLLQTVKVSYPWYQAIWVAAKETVLLTGRIIMVFWDMLVNLLTQGKVDANVAGPVGIAVITGQMLDLGWVPLLQFTALLSLNLTIINALPFPALDGGRVLFLLIEKIRRRKVSQKVENAIHSIGFGLLLTLILVVTFRDFVRFNIVQVIQNLF